MESLRLAPLDTSAQERPDALMCVLPPVSPPPHSAKPTSRWVSGAFETTPSAVPSSFNCTPPLSLPNSAPLRSSAPPSAMSIHSLTDPESEYRVSPSARVNYTLSEGSSMDALSLKKPRKRTRRTPTGIREVYACPYPNCDKVSSENSNLKAHMRLHTGEKPYVCNRVGCQKRFRWKSSLTYHEKALHTNQRPFVCSCCSKSFVEKRKLILHRDWCPAVRQQMQLMQQQQQLQQQQQQQQQPQQ